MDALGVTKALIIFGLGLTGLHAGEDYGAESPQQTIQRRRAAAHLRNR
jgi:hypothetical protein